MWILVGSAPEILRAMEYGKHVDLVGFDVVNDTVRPFDDFSDLLHFILRDRPTGQGELTDLLGSPGHTLQGSKFPRAKP